MQVLLTLALNLAHVVMGAWRGALSEVEWDEVE